MILSCSKIAMTNEKRVTKSNGQCLIYYVSLKLFSSQEKRKTRD